MRPFAHCLGEKEIAPPPGGFPSFDPGSDALLLDIDGTILDIAITPEAVRVPESLKTSLSTLRDRAYGALGLISGRTLSSIDTLFAPLKFAAVACHGAEIRRSPDADVLRDGDPLSEAGRARFAQIGELDPRIRVEDKRYTVAIHFRRVRELEPAIAELVDQRLAVSQESLRVLRGKDVIEIESGGFNKGTGLRTIMQSGSFRGRRPIFFGDDKTDEHAFAVLPEFRGVGISVGRPLPGAKGCVATPRAVRHWLAYMAEQPL